MIHSINITNIGFTGLRRPTKTKGLDAHPAFAIPQPPPEPWEELLLTGPEQYDQANYRKEE